MWGLLGAIGGLFRFIGWLYDRVWSDAAKWHAVELWRARWKAKSEAETDRVQDAYKQIEAQPPATGPDLEDKLNDAWKKKP